MIWTWKFYKGGMVAKWFKLKFITIDCLSKRRETVVCNLFTFLVLLQSFPKIYFSVKLRKENEEIEKHGNIFGDLLKGWFKGE